jgi:hypothetical protein
MKDFTHVNGWSARYSITNRIREEFKIQLEGAPATVTVTTISLADGEISVDLARPNHPPETVFRRNGRPRRVSRSQYASIFSGPG